MTHTPHRVELDRICQLNSRPTAYEDLEFAEFMWERVNAALHKPNLRCECKRLGRDCILTLNPVQCWALWEAQQIGGLTGPIGVGHGKTWLDILACLVVDNCKLALLLIPANMKQTVLNEYDLIRQHWHVPSIRFPDGTGHIVPGSPVLHVLTYNALSRPESSAYINALHPDLIICDEVQNIADPKSTRRLRLNRYMQENPTTRFMGWSGTIFGVSLMDAAPCAGYALKERSPLPVIGEVQEQWACVIDPKGVQVPTGPLAKLMQPHHETIRQAVKERCQQTMGWVFTTDSSTSIKPHINLLKLDVPEQIKEHLETVRESWERPDGEVLTTNLDRIRVLRQLAAGFYYRWRFPRNEPRQLIEEWKLRRKNWLKECQQKIQRNEVYLDSYMLVRNAAIRFWNNTGDKISPDKPIWKSKCWPAWQEIEDLVKPETETVWVDRFLVDYAVEWARKEPSIVWYAFSAFGAEVARLGKLTYHGGGPNAERDILAERGDRSIVASLQSHGVGRNGLQFYFKRQLLANPPDNGRRINQEQVLGRLHRPGQKYQVITDIPIHTPEYEDAFDLGVTNNKWSKEITGNDNLMSGATIKLRCR